ncbi:integral membrane protein, YjbE family, partial [Bordetella bronchiseptica E012]|uniref:YjbE family putative metal transport protein n=1 Tax=Bordetella bronchiseptica TaxID=518 RepID=UPI000461E873
MVEAIETFHWGAIFQIVLIDILLGGDNAVVIALACRNLPHRQRIKGILWGTAGAVLLRVLLIAFALVLLDIPFLKALGCLLLVWIGVKLLAPHEDAHGNITGGTSVLAAIRTIILADFAMSLDNVIASFSILADIATQVGGPDVAVRSLVGPDGDAHEYEPTPADARKLAAAQVLVVNGLDFEAWLPRLQKAAGFAGRTVVASEGIEPRRLDDAHE